MRILGALQGGELAEDVEDGADCLLCSSRPNSLAFDDDEFDLHFVR